MDYGSASPGSEFELDKDNLNTEEFQGHFSQVERDSRILGSSAIFSPQSPESAQGQNIASDRSVALGQSAILNQDITSEQNPTLTQNLASNQELTLVSAYMPPGQAELTPVQNAPETVFEAPVQNIDTFRPENLMHGDNLNPAAQATLSGFADDFNNTGNAELLADQIADARAAAQGREVEHD